MSISDKIKKLREKSGLSPEEFAEKVGVSRQTAAGWESGASAPDLNNLVSLSRLFGVSTDYLLSDEAATPQEKPESSPTALCETSSPSAPVPAPAPASCEESAEEDDEKSGGNSTVKKIIAVVAAVCIIAGAACFPLYSGALKKLWRSINSDDVKHTYVLVHGLGGWGESGALNSVTPYWGATTGSLAAYLRSEGYEVCVPTVGPISSAWDRACELYAQLTGTRVDYGEAHSKEHNHSRYGRSYSVPLVSDWGKKGKDVQIDLIGHSFGGATVRLLASLLAYGNEAEQKAGGDKVSPLFEGGKAELIHSVTTLCAPHNGSSLTCVADSLGSIAGLKNTTELLANICFSIISSAMPKSEIFDFMLDQFGISTDTLSEENFRQVLDKITANGTDNAVYDLSPDGAAKLNKTIRTVDSIYYFSYAYCTTKKGTLLNCQVPKVNTLPVLMPAAVAMGSYNGTTKGGITIDDSWKPNDGLVSVVSAQFPAGEEHTAMTEDYSGMKPGIWYVAETLNGDHGTVIGLMANAGETHAFYDKLFKMLTSVK